MSARIMFVNPPIVGAQHEWEQHLGSKLPALGLCALAAYTRREGFDTALLDAYNLGLSPESTMKKVLEFSPRYVGITATTATIFLAAKFAELIKEQCPQIITVIGGSHVSAMPMETMQEFRAFDIAVVGEGEQAIVDILRLVEPFADLSNIKGVIYRGGDDSLKRTEKRSYLEDLDRLPFPAWDLLTDFPGLYRPSLTNYKKLPVASLVTSRGCPYKCTFCDRSVFGNRWRSFSATYVVDLIKDLKAKYGIREISFYDDTFTVNKKRLHEMCEQFIKNNLNLSWSCLGRVDLADTETLKLMKKAGCWLISYGIESATPEILSIYKKDISLSQIDKAVRLTKEAGILTRGFFIIGGPLETENTILQIKDLIHKIPLDDLHISFFTPIPGSEMYENADKYGRFNKEWSSMDVYEINFVPNDLNENLLLQYRSDLYRSFYLRPARLLRYLKLLLNPERASEIISRGFTFLRLISKDKKKNAKS